MAIAAAVNDVYEVVIEGRQEGQLTANVLHFACVGADTDVDLHLIQVLLQCFITNLLPVLSSQWTLERVRWKKVSPDLGIEQISIPAGGAAAGAGGTALPSLCAAVISKRTLFAGRGGRGRMYIAGIPESATENSNIDTAEPLWAGLLGFALCVINNFVHPDPAGGSNIWDFMVFSRKMAVDPDGKVRAPHPGNAFHAVRQFVPVQLIATMRSRKLGRGA